MIIIFYAYAFMPFRLQTGILDTTKKDRKPGLFMITVPKLLCRNKFLFDLVALALLHLLRGVPSPGLHFVIDFILQLQRCIQRSIEGLVHIRA